ncbi:MAG: RNB domain-containing ribonuclease, partial [Lachnospiraceae bacterium]|nr:RNB domain-containing ribonuclease [Lachnospiraceae bacterium]
MSKKAKKEKIITVTGIFTGTSHEFGFVESEEVEGDIFIAGKYVNGAMHSDTVLVELFPGNPGEGKRREGMVVKIVERGIKRVVGTFQKSKHYGFVVPDNQRIGEDVFIPKEHCKGAVDGHKVVAEITEYPHGRRSAEGRVIEILGHANDPGVDILSIVEGYEIPTKFPEKVLNQAERIGMEVSEADMAGRLDLRDVVMVTIDGEDAKDLDDAVSIRKNGEFYELGVHISDVTNYVQENSALYKEALKRGTSVYLAYRVIPM